ncbi:hypothetical protein EVAR_58787_1 [Eumeta japonica]|uniref:Uncharacterized protein n=1 Tax=Eumeta variegata TaxID=151549 RepID=A0A4C1YH64_EUMVA|nr:hypothetical protein EVAR_58787_1 [Eumeta japonica]
MGSPAGLVSVSPACAQITREPPCVAAPRRRNRANVSSVASAALARARADPRRAPDTRLNAERALFPCYGRARRPARDAGYARAPLY